MRKQISFTLLCLISVLLSNCARKITSSAAADKANLTKEKAAVMAKYSDEQLKSGMLIFRTNCNKCHKYHEPEEFGMKKWEKVLPVMSQKAKLSAEQAENLRAWVIAKIPS